MKILLFTILYGLNELCDGYYNYNDWQPRDTDFTFNDRKTMITNIIP